MTDTPPSAQQIRAKQEAFLALIDPHYDGFVRYVRAMARDAEDARDIVNEALLVAFSQFEAVRKPESILFYLITIAKRINMKLYRRGLWHVRYDRRYEDIVHDSGAAPDSLPDVGILYAAIGKLPTRMREAVVLFEISGLSLEEIRVVQGGSLSGVKARVVRGRRKLAELLGVDNHRVHESRKKPSAQGNLPLNIEEAQA